MNVAQTRRVSGSIEYERQGLRTHKHVTGEEGNANPDGGQVRGSMFLDRQE